MLPRPARLFFPTLGSSGSSTCNLQKGSPGGREARCLTDAMKVRLPDAPASTGAVAVRHALPPDGTFWGIAEFLRQSIDVGEMRNVAARIQRTAAECLHLAEQAKSEREREFFIGVAPGAASCKSSKRNALARH